MQLERTSIEGPWEELKALEKNWRLVTMISTTQRANYLEEHSLYQCSLQINCIRLDSSFSWKRKLNTKTTAPDPQIPHFSLKGSPKGGNFLCRSLLVTAETDTWLFACCPHPTSAHVLLPFSSRAKCQLGDTESLGSYLKCRVQRWKGYLLTLHSIGLCPFTISQLNPFVLSSLHLYRGFFLNKNLYITLIRSCLQKDKAEKRPSEF